MFKNWYIVHIYLGQESKVVSYIENTLKNQDIGIYVGEAKIPLENIWEMYNGKKRQVKKKIFPGYILLELNLPDSTEKWKKICSTITNINGVTGFVGVSDKNQKPVPISSDEAKEIFQRMGEIKNTDSKISKVSFVLSETVRVNDGPFNNFIGVVEDINYEKNKVKVRVEIFGRSTPVELDFLQIEQI